MHWLIQEKIFAYFYNRFRPVNRMYIIKCAVNISLHNSGCCIRSVAPWISFITTHSIHKEGDVLQIYFCVTFHETRHHTQAHVTSDTLYTALSLAARRTQTANQWVDFAGQCLLWLLQLRFHWCYSFASLSSSSFPPPPPQNNV